MAGFELARHAVAWRRFYQFSVGLLVFDTERIFGPERVESLRLLKC